MAIGFVDSLRLVDVLDHGKPNLERVAIYVEKPCELSEYCLFLTMSVSSEPVAPIRDHMLWFGSGSVNPGDWIFVYTASGSTTITPNPQARYGGPTPNIINIHWGKDHTVFQNRSVNPVLVKISAIAAMAPPAPVYQGNPSISQPRLY
jgi:hypothetical protein